MPTETPHDTLGLKVDGLNLRFGGLHVLRDVSFQVEKGCVLGLVGPNGAGKSALMNCITGLYSPDRGGRVHIHGRRIDHLPTHDRASLGLSRTFQHADLVPGLTVAQNIRIGEYGHHKPALLREWLLPMQAHRRSRAALERVRHIAARCGLEADMHRLVDDLPLATRRRVDLARALISQPKVLLLDEPASGMSRQERTLIPELIQIAQQDPDVTVVWIEHDLDLVLGAAHSAVVLHHGQKIFESDRLARPGSRAEVLSAYLHGDAPPALRPPTH